MAEGESDLELDLEGCVSRLSRRPASDSCTVATADTCVSGFTCTRGVNPSPAATPAPYTGGKLEDVIMLMSVADSFDVVTLSESCLI